jgi:hypothetical protein
MELTVTVTVVVSVYCLISPHCALRTGPPNPNPKATFITTNGEPGAIKRRQEYSGREQRAAPGTFTV